MADKIKCKGCGRMVWAGSKIIDGYCHDCYVRGRHLPKDDEPWAGGPPPKKKTKPFSPPPTVRRRFSLPKIGRKWLLLPLLLVALALVFNGAFWLKSLAVSLSDEIAVMGLIQDESNSTFYTHGEKLDYEAVVPNIRVIDTFLASGASYRIRFVSVTASQIGSKSSSVGKAGVDEAASKQAEFVKQVQSAEIEDDEELKW